jgi:transcriptional regulator GlxA family with amidase domain
MRAASPPRTRVAVVCFDGFNELDTFLLLGLLNSLQAEDGWRAEITGPVTRLRSMNGVVVDAQQPLEFANEADIVLFGSGLYARAIAENSALLDRLQLDPLRQLIGGQNSGVLLMARLGLLGDMPASTDDASRPWLAEAGVRVSDTAFQARGPIATAGGCLAAQYLATWALWQRAGVEATQAALLRAAPVGEKVSYVQRLIEVVRPFTGTPR